jgi:predicted Zn-dependent protease
MIGKTILQGLAIAAGIFVLWLGFSQIDFMRIFHVRQLSGKTEQKLGEMIWKNISLTSDVVENDTLNRDLDSIVMRLATANHIDAKKIKVHLVRKDELNAFALPGNHLVVYTGLIEKCANAQELAGVMGHEMAHIEKNHVMRKLVKEFGLSLLVSASTGSRSPEVASQIVKMLSAAAYDRSLESEADLASVDYMIRAHIDPKPLAHFMRTMAKEDMPSTMYWIADHPESLARAKAIDDYITGKKYTVAPVISAEQWEIMKSAGK